MKTARIVPAKDIIRADLRYIDIQFDSLGDGALLGMAGPLCGCAKTIRAKLLSGELAYLNPKPGQTLLLTDGNYHLSLYPHPRIEQHQQPAKNLLAELQRLRVTTSAPNCPDNPRKQFAYTPYDPDTYTSESPQPDIQHPRWQVLHTDELGHVDQHRQVPFCLEPPSAADKQEGKVADLFTARFRQAASESAELTLFPDHCPVGKGQVKSHNTGKRDYQLFDGQQLTLQDPENTENPTFYTKAMAHQALIVLPTLTTPALHHTDNKYLSVILAVPGEFHKAVENERSAGSEKNADSIGPISLRRIHNQLRIQPFASIDKHRTTPGQRLYSDLDTARQNIRLHHLKKLPSGKAPIKNKQGRYLGILDPEALKAWDQADYAQFYQVDLHGLAQGTGLYNLQWFCPDSEFPDTPDSPPSPYGDGCLHEPEDKLQTTYLDSLKSDHKTQPGEYPNPCLNSSTERQGQRLYAPSKIPFSNPKGAWLHSTHPVLISNKAQLNPGQLSDVHISSRQSLYPQSDAQVIPGADPATSAPLGKAAHNNAASLQRLLDKVGQDNKVDILLLTGDLYDHVINADPAHPEHQKIKTPGKLWKAFDHNQHDNRERYPSHIDAYYALSLIHHFMKQYQKPVLFIDGNHEAYDMPYGISPRLLKTSPILHGQRANAGIPTDHNLSIYEATLLYGPDYGHYHHIDNFNAGKVHWLRRLLSPWRDWVLGYGKQQTWIGLSWGDDESIFSSALEGGGSLPRADDALSNDQWAMLQDAVDKRQAKQNILLSHFTFVNYATDIALNTQGKVDANNISLPKFGIVERHNWLSDRDNWDEGSFHGNRETLYEDYLQPGKIHYTFSGHSHRAGVYTLDGEPGFFTSKMPINGHYPDGYEHKCPTACLIVTGSGGPLSWQNREGEYGGYGIEAPQGIKLDAASGKISIIRDNTVKPRMAVVQDFLWYEGGHKALAYPLKGDGKTFTLRVRKDWIKAGEHGVGLLDEIRLHLHAGGKDGYQGYASLQQTGDKPKPWRAPGHQGQHDRGRGLVVNYAVSGGGMSWDRLQKTREQITFDEKKPHYFLSIHFKQIETGPLHDHYDYNSPWCFPAEMDQGGDKVWFIQRMSYKLVDLGDLGEVPDFDGAISDKQLFADVYDYDGGGS